MAVLMGVSRINFKYKNVSKLKSVVHYNNIKKLGFNILTSTVPVIKFEGR